MWGPGKAQPPAPAGLLSWQEARALGCQRQRVAPLQQRVWQRAAGGGQGLLQWLLVWVRQRQRLLLPPCWQECHCHPWQLQRAGGGHQGERPGTPGVLRGAAGVAGGGAQ